MASRSVQELREKMIKAEKRMKEARLGTQERRFAKRAYERARDAYYAAIGHERD